MAPYSYKEDKDGTLRVPPRLDYPTIKRPIVGRHRADETPRHVRAHSSTKAQNRRPNSRTVQMG